MPVDRTGCRRQAHRAAADSVHLPPPPFVPFGPQTGEIVALKKIMQTKQVR